jgi:methenyltetrahydromethanopterin cyclohydrolase
MQSNINLLSQPLVDALVADAGALGLIVSHHETGAVIIDAKLGSVESGRRIAEICMGGLGAVGLSAATSAQTQNFDVNYVVRSSAQHAVLSCLGSQYAGWALQHEKFFSLGSGPARVLAQREDLFKELAITETAEKTSLVLETEKMPPKEVIEKVARDTKINAENLTFILTPTTSIAGTTQIVSRVLEVALHKLHTLHFALSDVLDGYGTAPIPPVSKDFITAMGRSNDAILFGGHVHLNVRGSDSAAKALADKLPSSASKDYGKPFAEVFRSVNMDFYQIDPMLFSPAKVTITAVESGNSFTAGEIDETLLAQSFKS